VVVRAAYTPICMKQSEHFHGHAVALISSPRPLLYDGSTKRRPGEFKDAARTKSVDERGLLESIAE